MIEHLRNSYGIFLGDTGKNGIKYSVYVQRLYLCFFQVDFTLILKRVPFPPVFLGYVP